MSFSFSGSGPGAQTADGCSVEFYRQLPYMGELDAVMPIFPTGGSVLELGCGTGRLCAHLASAGLQVTGVDDSAEMLSALPAGVNAVQSSIESLVLRRSFDVVLLASHLINHPAVATREAFVGCARRHLRNGGRLLLERHDPGWLAAARPGLAGRAGQVEFHVEAIARDHEFVHMTLRYERAGQTWRRTFTTVTLSEAQIEEQLRRSGFADVSWHGERTLWASAVAN